MIFGLSTKIVDVETTFLYRNLDEEIFMNCPEVLDGATDQDAVKLQKCIYGLVQAARQYRKKIVEMLKSIGFEGGDVNPCLYM